VRLIRLPPGYRRLESRAGGGSAVAHERYAEVVEGILCAHTLYEWAAAHPERRELQGRGPVYAVPLTADGPRVVVRHGRRGGLIAPLLRDLYLPPTPAPIELTIAFVLARSGVPTPPVMAYATYPVAGFLRRVDVMTLEVNGLDLASALAADSTAEARRALRPAVARLLVALTDAGAWHQDLNARNILIADQADGTRHAVLLDVDRVRFAPAGDPNVLAANLERLTRSLQKLRAQSRPAFDDEDLREIRVLAEREEAERAARREERLADRLT
jgi:3-deoxy-D-manno-octulosonic acid kinase